MTPEPSPSHRELYSQSYLESGCTRGWHPDYDIDDIPATYYTAYLLAATLLVIGVILRCVYHIKNKNAENNKDRNRVNKLLTAFMLTSAIAYGTFGYGHQTLHDTWLQPLMIFFFQWLTNILLFAGNFFLELAEGAGGTLIRCIENDKEDNDESQTGKYKYWTRLTVLMILAVAHTLVLLGFMLKPEMQTKLLSGLIIATCLSISLIHGWQLLNARRQKQQRLVSKTLVLVAKIVAMAIVVFGFVVRQKLTDACGVPSYKRNESPPDGQACFHECPLPDATRFNHNALFNCLATMGYGLYGMTLIAAVLCGQDTPTYTVDVSRSEPKFSKSWEDFQEDIHENIPEDIPEDIHEDSHQDIEA